jgi:hypothetical protein
LKALAERVPRHADCITIFADPDDIGMRHAAELQRLLRARGLFATVAELPEESR